MESAARLRDRTGNTKISAFPYPADIDGGRIDYRTQVVTQLCYSQHSVELLMETLTIRDLRNRPGAVQANLADKGELLLTSNGRPVAIMLSVDGATLDDTWQAVRLARGQLALRKLRRQAREQGIDGLAPEAIDKLIDEVRRARS